MSASPPSYCERRYTLVLALGAAVGASLVVAADAATAALARVLPFAAEVRSAGTGYPSFGDAFPTILRATGAVVLVGVIAGVALSVMVGRVEPPTWRPRWIVAGLALASGVAYGWLAWPHNAFPTNSRVHWVDIFYERADSFVYALVKIPHTVFYGAPWLLQAMNGALNVALMGWLVQRTTHRPWASVGAATSFAVSSYALRFANSAEDVQLAMTSLLLVAIAYAGRRPYALAVALFVAMLARPSFLLAVPAVVIAELVGREAPALEAVRDRLIAAFSQPLLRRSLATFTVLFVAWHAALHAFAEPWLLTDGRLIASGAFELSARAVDGYVIAPWDGAYIGHLAWLVPVPVWLAIALVVVRARRLTIEARRHLVFAGSFVAGSIVVHESLVLFYFNIRYLAYLVPFILSVAWLVPRVVDAASRKAAVVAAGVTLALSSAVAPHLEFTTRERVAAHPLGLAVPDGHHLRMLTDGAPIATTYARRHDRNFVAYLFRRPFEEIVALDAEEPPPAEAFVVTDEPSRFTGTVVFDRDGFAVVAPTGADR